MAENTWHVGTMYIQPSGPGGYFSQPGGPFTQVFPAQVTGSTDYFSERPFSELTGQYMMGCQHSVNYVTVYVDVYMTDGIRVALLCCSICSYIQRVIKPAEDALTGSSNASLANLILYP